VIRIVRNGVVVFESDDLYKIADWLHYEDKEVKMLEVRVNQEAYDKAQAAKW
jgi:hypothetical protein|tara:strand:+ start:1943 stop:2098 length:156 start_codon:yes stop_codon:yes gene_type:complete